MATEDHHSSDEYDGSDDGTSSSEFERCKNGDPDEEETKHFLDVCWSFIGYQRDGMHDLTHFQETLANLDPHDRELWPCQPNEWLKDIARRVEANQAFCSQLPTPCVCSSDLGPNEDARVATVPPGYRVASRNASKVRSTLRQFVRDWAVEGQPERDASYLPLTSALAKYLPPRYRGPGGQVIATKVLCPGCGLARLPFDLAVAGYAAQGNEFSYHMLLGSYLILNASPAPFCHTIYPFVLSTTNRTNANDHLTQIRVPDICPGQVMPPDGQLSMAAGEFVDVYSNQPGYWDAVLTCFFLDTAKNVLIYIRRIAEIIRAGGYWINLGPLLYHFADMEQEVSIELSWEELRPCILTYFDFVEEDTRTSMYTGNPGSLQGTRYKCVFFVARRNSEPAAGVSNPVF